MRIFKESHSAENYNGDLLGFLKLQFAAEYQKSWGGPFGNKKKSKKKVAQCRKNLLEKVSGWSKDSNPWPLGSP